jgi:ABC-type amino acid transport substrate-binding protein
MTVQSLLKPIMRSLLCLALVTMVAATASAQSKYDKVLQKKELTVGAQEGAAPYGYVDEKGELAGWAVDLSKALHALIEKKLGIKIALEFRKVTPETRIPLIVNGSLDWVLGSTGITVDREEVVDFSLINNTACIKMLNRKSTAIRDIKDLAGKRIGVTNGSVEQRLLTEMGQNGKLKPAPQVIAFPTHAVGFLALEQRRTDVHVTLDSALMALQVNAKNPSEWTVHGPDLFCTLSGIILPQNDSKWRHTVNNALCYLIENGEYDKLYDEWFGPKNPKAGFPLPQSAMTKTVIHNQCPFGIDNWLPKT